MFFKTIFLRFTSLQAIKNLKFGILLQEIIKNDGRSQLIKGVYILDSFNPYNILNLINNLSNQTIIIKLLESVTKNNVILDQTNSHTYIIQLFLSNTADNYRQLDYWDNKQIFKEVVLFPIPSFNPGITYSNQITKKTLAANGDYYMLSKSSNVDISPTLEDVEENYLELSKGSPLPFSLASVNYSIKQLDEVYFNSTSLSSPVYTQLDDTFYVKTFYLVKYNDKSLFATASLLTVVGKNINIRIFPGGVNNLSYFYTLPIGDEPVNIYAFPSASEDLIFRKSGENYYINLKRFDCNIAFAFEPTDINQPSSLAAIWGYYSNNFTYYEKDLQTISINELLINNEPFYSIINTINNDSINYNFDINDPNLNLISGIKISKNDGNFLTYYSSINSILILSRYPFFKIKSYSKIIKITIFADGYGYIEINGALPNERAFNYSKSSLVLINIIYEEEIVDNDYGITFAGDPTHANLEIYNNPQSVSDPAPGKRWAYDGDLGVGVIVLVNSTDSALTFEKFYNDPGSSVPESPWYIIKDWKNYKGCRIKYYGDGLEQLLMEVYLSGTTYTAPETYNFGFNQLFYFDQNSYPYNQFLDSEYLFINISFIYNKNGDPLGIDPNEFIKKLNFENLLDFPPELPNVDDTILDLPNSYHASFYDSINFTNTFKFGLPNFFTSLIEPISVNGRLIRKDVSSITNDSSQMPNARIFDYFNIRLPNFGFVFPLNGLPEYKIPYDNLEVSFLNDSGISRVKLNKGAYLKIIPQSDPSIQTSLTFQNNLYTLTLSLKNNSFYSFYLTLSFNVDPQRMRLLSNYSSISGYASVTNAHGKNPIQIKSDLAIDYNDLNVIFCSSRENCAPIFCKFKPKNNFRLEIKLPIIDITNIQSYNIKDQKYSINERQIFYNLLAQIAYYE